jgi:hypothetical protein
MYVTPHEHAQQMSQYDLHAAEITVSGFSDQITG